MGRAAGAGWNEKVADGREDTDEPLQVPGRSKALPRPFSPAERRMRILYPVVKPFVRAVLDLWHDLPLGRSIRSELVGDHPSRRAALLAQQTFQQALSGFGVAPRLHDLIERIAVLIDSPPQPVLLPKDGDHDFVAMPTIATVWSLAPEADSIRGPELQRPSPDGHIGDKNAALEQHLLNQPQAQGKPEVQPDRMSDNLGREAMVFVANGLAQTSRSTRLPLIVGLM